MNTLSALANPAWIDYTVAGIVIGNIHALLAIGLAMMFGVANLINFAQGSIFTVGAYVGWTILVYLRLPLAVAIPAVLVVSAVVGVAIERLGSAGDSAGPGRRTADGRRHQPRQHDGVRDCGRADPGADRVLRHRAVRRELPQPVRLRAADRHAGIQAERHFFARGNEVTPEPLTGTFIARTQPLRIPPAVLAAAAAAAILLPFLNVPYLIQMLTNVLLYALLALSLTLVAGTVGQVSLGHTALLAIGAYASALIGSLIVVGLPEFFRLAADYRVLIYGLALLLLIRFRPQGLLGTV